MGETVLSKAEKDQEIVAMVLGDGLEDRPAVVNKIHEHYEKLVFSICLRFTGNVGDAEDITQEVFLQLLSKVSSFRGNSKFSTWLTRFTINEVLMVFRKRKILTLVSYEGLIEEESPELLRRTMMTDRHLRSTVCRVSIQRALLLLSPKKRIAVLLNAEEGYDQVEAAEVLHISVSAYKSRLHWARRELLEVMT